MYALMSFPFSISMQRSSFIRGMQSEFFASFFCNNEEASFKRIIALDFKGQLAYVAHFSHRFVLLGIFEEFFAKQRKNAAKFGLAA